MGHPVALSCKDILIIQGDSGGRVNNLGGYSIGQCEEAKKVRFNVSSSEWIPR